MRRALHLLIALVLTLPGASQAQGRGPRTATFLHFNDVYEIGAIDGVAKYHHIAALWLAAQDAARNRAECEGAGIARIAIGHFVHKDEIADQQSIFHRFRRNPERLKEQGAEQTRNHQRIDHRFDRLDNATVAFRHGLGSFHKVRAVTCARGRGESSCRWLWAGLDHHKRLCPRVIIGQSDVNKRGMAGGGHAGQPFSGPTGQMHHRLTRNQIGHCHIAP